MIKPQIPRAKFPKWMPDWVRSEYEEIRTICLGGDFDDGDYVDWWYSNRCNQFLPVLNKIIAANSGEDKQTRSIWAALEKRRGEVAKRRAFADKFWWNRANTLGSLAETIVDARDSFNSLHRVDKSASAEKVTKAKVQKKFEDIAEAAESFSQILKEVNYADGKGAFAHIHESIAIAAHDCMDLRWQELILFNGMDASSDLPEALAEVAKALATNFADFLLAIARNAVDLEKIDSMVGKPNDKNAQRTYFFCFLNRTFNEIYGSPLHEINLAVTSAFHDCDRLSAANVATIVRGATKRSRKK